MHRAGPLILSIMDHQFKKGNQIWRLAKNPGRKKKYTPKTLLQKAYEYFEHCDNNPWYKNEAIKSGEKTGTIIEVPTQRPYTETAFFVFAGIDVKTFKNYESENDFLPVVTHIRDIIRANQIEGSMVGAYNATIVARVCGLVDKTESEVNIRNEYEGMTDEELEKKIALFQTKLKL